MKHFFCLLAILCPLLILAQERSTSGTKALSIGDAVPDILLTNVMNHPVSTIQLSDLTAGLIILDFWSSWCGACISQFPHMDSLRSRFGSKLQLILVNGKSQLSGDDRPKIEKILRTQKQRTGSALAMPVIFDNPLLDTLFPYNYIPHEVWLQAGKVVAITSALEVTEANIEALLQHQPVAMRTKKDLIGGEAPVSLLQTTSLAGGAAPYAQSILTGYQDGLHGMGDRRDAAGSSLITGLYYYNVTLEQLLRDAYTHTDKFQVPTSRVVLEVKDPMPFQTHTDTAIYRYSYCYESSVPPTTYPFVRSYLQQDLERAFHLNITSEKRKLSCLVVTATTALKKSRTKGGEPTIDWEPQSQHKFVRNYSVTETLEFLDRVAPFPIIDETGSTLQLDMELPRDITSKSQMIQALRKAGFAVSEEQRLLEVTVVSDR